MARLMTTSKPNKTATPTHLVHDGDVNAQSVHDAPERNRLEEMDWILQDRRNQLLVQSPSGIAACLLPGREAHRRQEDANDRQHRIHPEVVFDLEICRAQVKRHNSTFAIMQW